MTTDGIHFVWEGQGRSTEIPLEVKLTALADAFVKGTAPRVAVEKAYNKIGRPVPKAPGGILSNWKATLGKRVQDGDKELFELFKKFKLLK